EGLENRQFGLTGFFFHNGRRHSGILHWVRFGGRKPRGDFTGGFFASDASDSSWADATVVADGTESRQGRMQNKQGRRGKAALSLRVDLSAVRRGSRTIVGVSSVKGCCCRSDLDFFRHDLVVNFRRHHVLDVSSR